MEISREFVLSPDMNQALNDYLDLHQNESQDDVIEKAIALWILNHERQNTSLYNRASRLYVEKVVAA